MTVVKRIFIVGPPGSEKEQKASLLAKTGHYNIVSMDQLLKDCPQEDEALIKKIESAKAKQEYGKFELYSSSRQYNDTITDTQTQ